MLGVRCCRCNERITLALTTSISQTISCVIERINSNELQCVAAFVCIYLYIIVLEMDVNNGTENIDNKVKLYSFSWFDQSGKPRTSLFIAVVRADIHF